MPKGRPRPRPTAKRPRLKLYVVLIYSGWREIGSITPKNAETFELATQKAEAFNHFAEVTGKPFRARISHVATIADWRLPDDDAPLDPNVARAYIERRLEQQSKPPTATEG